MSPQHLRTGLGVLTGGREWLQEEEAISSDTITSHHFPAIITMALVCLHYSINHESTKVLNYRCTACWELTAL